MCFFLSFFALIVSFIGLKGLFYSFFSSVSFCYRYVLAVYLNKVLLQGYVAGCVAACCSVLHKERTQHHNKILLPQRVTVCCSVRCSVLQCAALERAHYQTNMLLPRRVAVCCSVCCSVLQCVAVCCNQNEHTIRPRCCCRSVLHCVAVCCSVCCSVL